MRVVKDAKERRNEILDTAEEMFMLHGYEKTSVQELIDRVGIAKGTFYYYFKSKEEVLDSIVERYREEAIGRAARLAEDSSMDFTARFLTVLRSIQIADTVNPAVMEQIHMPQNALLHRKMTAGIIKGLTPVLTRLVQEGVDEGIFHTDFPQETVEMILIYAIMMVDGDIYALEEEEKRRKAAALFWMGERLLGMERDAVRRLAESGNIPVKSEKKGKEKE